MNDSRAEPPPATTPTLADPGIPVGTPNSGTLAYFDNWVWVALSRARKSSSDALARCWRDLKRASDSGALQVALSSGNYLELWNRRGAQSRHDVARTMAELTGYVTMRAVHEVLDAEMSLAIGAWRSEGKRTSPPKLTRGWLIGVGARHAFGSVSGRFRFVSELATESRAEGDELAMPREWGDAFDRLPPAVFEWVNLAGLDCNYNIPGIDYRPSHRLGDEWVAEQQAYRERVASTRRLSPRDDPSVLFRLIIARQLRLATGEAPSATFEPAEAQNWFQGPVDGASFIAALPTQQVMSHLLYDAHRDPTYRFRQHDRVDILELGLTMPYCDVVVPDKHWASHARGMKLDAEYDTRVLSGARQLDEWAHELAGNPS